MEQYDSTEIFYNSLANAPQNVLRVSIHFVFYIRLYYSILPIFCSLRVEGSRLSEARHKKY